ncbi:hypothetical protein TWF694_006203 [Orbilia ellipsospora]|uniref:Uncharacterized protein n=1 Tax=Orbilia ellipsospora TaxID=2528407 RepID=A0AAV9XJE3_9PEZI
MAWLCQFPGEKSPEQMCEKSINDKFNLITTGLGGQLTNIGEAAGVIAKYFPATKIGQLIAVAAEGIAGVAAGELLIDALGVLALTSIAITLVGQDNIAYGICSVWHINDGPLVLHLITANQDLGIDILSIAPAPTYDAGTITINDPTQTACACTPGVCGTFSIIYSGLCGPLGDCVCAQDVSGKGACVQDVRCTGATPCSSNADCPGGACWVNSCCGGSICAQLSTACTPSSKRSVPYSAPPGIEMERRSLKCKSGALCS